jgi:hypothetical protein
MNSENKKKELINNEFLHVYDVLAPRTVKKIYKDCQKHFEQNLNIKSSRPNYKVTHCIIDCHDSEQHWNSFYKTVCKYVKDYLKITAPELLKQTWNPIDDERKGYQVYPHSCWAVEIPQIHPNRCALNKDFDFMFPEDKFLTAIYYLQNSNIENGTTVKKEDKTYYTSQGIENSLFIFKDLPQGEMLPCLEDLQIKSKIIIRFDFVILGDHHKVPPTIIPLALL